MIGVAALSSRSARLGPPIKRCDPRPVPDLSFGKVAPQIAARPPVTATRQAVSQPSDAALAVAPCVSCRRGTRGIGLCQLSHPQKKFGVGAT